MFENSMTKKTFVFAVVLLMIVTMLACSGTSPNAETPSETETPSAANEPDNEKETEAAQEPATEQEPEGSKEVTFVFRGAIGKEAFDAKYGNMIREKFPDYTINFLEGEGGNINQVILNQTPFDIYYETTGSYVRNAMQYDFHYDMRELIEKHNVDLSRLDPAFDYLLNEAYNGEIYYLPVHGLTWVTYFNKELFDKFNIPYLTDGVTWDEIYEVNRQMTRMEDGIQYIGYNPLSQLYWRQDPMGIPLYDVENYQPTINTDPRWKSFFEIYAKELGDSFPDKEVLKEIIKTHPMVSFFTERRQGVFVGNSNLLSIPDYSEAIINGEIGVVSVPIVEGQPFTSAPFPDEFGISRNSKNKDAAMEVLAFLLSDEAQTEFARNNLIPMVDNPAIRAQLGQNVPQYDQINWDALFHYPPAQFNIFGPYANTLGGTVEKFFNQVLTGEVDVNTALRMAEEEQRLKMQDIDIWYKYIR